MLDPNKDTLQNSTEFSILASYLYMDYHTNQKPFKLDVSAFTVGTCRAMAKVINDEIDKGDNGIISYALLEFEEELSNSNSIYDQNIFLDILSTSPFRLDIAKKYHDNLVGKKYLRKLKVAV